MVAVCLQNRKYLHTSAIDSDVSSKFGLLMSAVIKPETGDPMATILKINIDSSLGVLLFG